MFLVFLSLTVLKLFSLPLHDHHPQPILLIALHLVLPEPVPSHVVAAAYACAPIFLAGSVDPELVALLPVQYGQLGNLPGGGVGLSHLHHHSVPPAPGLLQRLSLPTNYYDQVV